MLEIIQNTKIKQRPKFHFSAQKNWINDPNGLVFFDGEWHLFFQYNPFGIEWGHMHWGHAVSKDLLNWQELEIAIHEDEKNMIFSGSCVIDWKNTSGLGDGKIPPMIAIYTDCAQDFSVQTQSIAYSLDRGRSFTKYSGNPVLNINKQHFRDPKVFWNDQSGKWTMVVANSDINSASIFSSPNLIDWQFESEFGPCGANGHLWECPDLFPLQVSGSDEVKWVFKIDIFEYENRPYSMAQYFIGDFNGKEFIPNRDENGHIIWHRADFGHDFYASMSFADVPNNDGRRIWIAWMNSHHYAKLTPEFDWRGSMTLPRELGLLKQNGNYYLIQNPTNEFSTQKKTELNPNSELKLFDQVFQYEFKIDTNNNQNPEFNFHIGDNDFLTLGFDGANNEIYFDRSKSSSLGSNEIYGQTQRFKRKSCQTILKLKAIIDVSSIEIFIDDGLQSLSEVFYATNDCLKLDWSPNLGIDIKLFAIGGNCG